MFVVVYQSLALDSLHHQRILHQMHKAGGRVCGVLIHRSPCPMAPRILPLPAYGLVATSSPPTPNGRQRDIHSQRCHRRQTPTYVVSSANGRVLWSLASLHRQRAHTGRFKSSGIQRQTASYTARDAREGWRPCTWWSNPPIPLSSGPSPASAASVRFSSRFKSSNIQQQTAPYTARDAGEGWRPRGGLIRQWPRPLVPRLLPPPAYGSPAASCPPAPGQHTEQQNGRY